MNSNSTQKQTQGDASLRRHREWPLFQQPRERKRPGFPTYAALILAPILAYAAMFGNPVLWTEYDDVPRSGYAALEDWTEALDAEALRVRDPLSLGSYFAEQALPLPTADAHRAINLCLHLAAVLLLFGLLRILRAPGALIAALAFALHPAAVQPLFWAGYRSDLLALVLILAALSLGLRNRGGIDYAGSLACAVLAGLLHPAGLLIPVPLALGILYRQKHPRLPDFNRVLPYVCIALFLGVWTSTGAEATDHGMEAMDRINNVGENIFFFMGQTLLPLELALFHPYTTGPGYQVGAGMSLLPFLVFIPFYVLIAIRFRQIWSRSVLLAMTAYLVFALYAALQPGRFLDGSLAYETHALYIALPAGIALVLCHLAAFVKHIARPLKPLWLGFAGLLLVVEFMLTASFAYAMGDPVRMWQSVEDKWPDSWIPKAALVDYSLSHDAEVYTGEKLIQTLNDILDQRPERHDLRRLLARTYAREGQSNNAVREYKRILRETEPSDDFLEEAARLFDKVGLTWDAQNARARKSSSSN